MLKIYRSSGLLVWKETTIAKLSNSELKVFLFLVCHINNFCEKGQLLEAGWPNKFVSPNSLAVAIKNLRVALNKTKGLFEIETMYSKGYLLKGDVSFILEYPTDETDEQPPRSKHTLNSASRDNNIILEHDDGDGTVNNSTSHVTDYSSEQERIDERSHSLSFLVEKSSIKNFITVLLHLLHRVKFVLICAYLTMTLFFALVIFWFSKDDYCYSPYVNQTICGVFPLNESQQSKLKEMLDGTQQGIFYYGHDEHEKEIKIVNGQ